ncbi:hypothetical protein BDN70DRAFT_886723 [Pholiota conissans]|uniref:Uncharacterized protein n=1 Tax=Pholiota conissans TaxID=109636 RepID=A0A9P5YMW2_9AGAR|nr:hypothetical protein BDN70DRAFT_886723 [Pholiota conissans]
MSKTRSWLWDWEGEKLGESTNELVVRSPRNNRSNSSPSLALFGSWRTFMQLARFSTPLDVSSSNDLFAFLVNLLLLPFTGTLGQRAADQQTHALVSANFLRSRMSQGEKLVVRMYDGTSR